MAFKNLYLLPVLAGAVRFVFYPVAYRTYHCLVVIVAVMVFVESEITSTVLFLLLARYSGLL